MHERSISVQIYQVQGYLVPAGAEYSVRNEQAASLLARRVVIICKGRKLAIINDMDNYSNQYIDWSLLLNEASGSIPS